MTISIAARLAVAPGTSVVSLEQFVDQTAGLKSIKLADAGTEHFQRDLFNLAFVDVLLSHDLFNEAALLVAATPGSSAGAVGVPVAVGMWMSSAIGGGWGGTVGGAAVGMGIGHEPDFLDGLIHRILQEAVEPAAFLLDLREVG
ncbi:hypothetical protein, partial [Prosthecobacter sp.]|uniref:hypothetical protein n=1 Tax=Prosthecobacter sp. TaxID=1965333 RepID=UPI0037C659B1